VSTLAGGGGLLLGRRADGGPDEGGGDGGEAGSRHHVSLVELPAEIILKILKYMTFRENAAVRLVRSLLSFMWVKKITF